MPTAVLVGATWMLAWDAGGSIRAEDWLAYGALAAVVLAVVLFSGSAVRPARTPLIAATLLFGFAAWTAVSAAWAPAPSFARDDALLSLLYVIALVTPLVTLRSGADRVTATAVVVLALGGLAIWSALYLSYDGDPEVHYLGGRLDFPVTYWNGQAALALVALWPALGLAARRSLTLVVRALALGSATAMLCLWLATQSKGGAVALGVSTVVVFAVSPSRMRLLWPVVIVGALGAVGAEPLTEPFRTDGQAFDDAVRYAGTITLILTGVGVLIGLLYAVVDTRTHISLSVRMWAARVALGLVCVAAAAVLVGFFASVDHPVRAAENRWADFKNINSGASASSHFGALGSNRYDFWRVAWNEFGRHPVVGIGGYGWGNAYLVQGRSLETPQRSHSVELDALSETGIIGFLLIVGAGIIVLVVLGAKARASVAASGALGSAVYFAVHTGGDWVWTIPAVGLPAFVIAGIALSEDRSSPLPRRIAVPAGVVSLLAAVLAFSPPWLSARLVQHAYDQPTLATAQNDLRWARRLDPLAVSPLLAEAALVDSPRDIPLLRRAVSKQPRNAELHFLLGLALADARQQGAAVRELRIARAMSPRDEAIQGALEEER